MLYINDIVNTTSLLELILYADDTTLVFPHPDIASQNEICNWFQSNKLSVNASKTNYMVLGTHHSTTKFIDATQDKNTLNDFRTNAFYNSNAAKVKTLNSTVFH